MRVAILSDIHGNLPALNAVLDDAARQKIKTFWCAGDVVGYGPWPVQCWSTLKKLNIAQNAWVAGNHDLGLIDGLDGGQYFRGEYFNEEAKIVLAHHRQVCQCYPEIFEQVKQIRIIVEPRQGVILAHGVPKPGDATWTVTKYTTSKTDAEQAVTALLQADMQPQMIIVGHSHQAIFWRRCAGRSGAEAGWQEEEPTGEIPLGDLSQQIVYLNPGSVGQPRDEGYEASYCYIDWDKMTVCFRRIPYPLPLTKRKMLDLEYPQALIDRWY
jgi:predicted phosphodiesterase